MAKVKTRDVAREAALKSLHPSLSLRVPIVLVGRFSAFESTLSLLKSSKKVSPRTKGLTCSDHVGDAKTARKKKHPKMGGVGVRARGSGFSYSGKVRFLRPQGRRWALKKEAYASYTTAQMAMTV
jgi:hypothetical protein